MPHDGPGPIVERTALVPHIIPEHPALPTRWFQRVERCRIGGSSEVRQRIPRAAPFAEGGQAPASLRVTITLQGAFRTT